MKKKLLFPLIVVAIILPMILATPAFAWTSTMLTVVVEREPDAVPGDPVILWITETNDGGLNFRPCYIEVYNVNDDTTDWYYWDDLYDNGDGGGTLDPGESYIWKVTYYPTVTTTWIITAHAWRNGVDYTYPLDQDEQAIVTVTIEEDNGEGLTPGFWKNHLYEWANTDPVYSPTDDFDATFGSACFDPDISLEAAVNLGGGGVDALARHAVAALLNAAHPGVDYAMTVGEVKQAVQDACTSGDYEHYKDIFEGHNETDFELYD